MILGIEIEPSSVKVAQLRKYELIQWEVFELPEEAVGPDGIIDSDSILKTFIKIPFKFNIKKPKIAFAVSGPTYTAVRIIQVPFKDKDEIALNLQLELDKYIPFSVKDVYYDFHIIEQLKDGTELLVAVASKQLVNEYINIFEKAGMIPQVVDIGALALHNVYDLNYTDLDTIALVNIGEGILNFVITKNKKPLYVKDSNFSFNIKDIQEAREEEIRNFADGVSVEIYRQLEYFKAFFTDELIKRIYITGFPVTFPFFISSIEERLDIEVLILNSFRKIRINKNISSKIHKYSNITSISIGLSLRGIERIR